jgi:transposase
MWSEQSRGRMAKIAKKTKRYPSDLTDEEWAVIAPLMPTPGRRGRPREVEFREVINAVRYLVRSGCGWRMLPVHFGHWRTVYGWFRELARRFLFQTIHDVALMLDRELAGREASPSAAVIDSQSIKAPHGKTRGYDAAYDRLKLMDKAAYLEFVIEIIRRSDERQGFEVLPRRWVVERTFGWMTRWRRLVRDYEARIDVSQAMILVAMGGNLLRRTTHP